MNLEETLSRTKVGPQWQKIGIRHHHGIDLPLSALHSKESCGIGEFYDLLPMIDWCHEIGMDVIQLLPLNDTGDDPSPFFALSAMALNPLYLSLLKLPNVAAEELLAFKHLNSTQRVSFHEVQSYKFVFFRKYYQEKAEPILESAAFKDFSEKYHWLKPYALFKTLKNLLSKNHWLTWPADLKNLREKEMDELIDKYWLEVRFHIFLQFLCYQQLFHVKQYANSKGIFLKGDIPILIAPDSADVWEYAEEFDLTFSAGAPPDYYSPDGQVWGLPIMRWEVMKERNYDWWKERLGYASNFYDIYRIDHVLGFFRIWAIPAGEPSRNGKFLPESEADWLRHGREILSLLVDHTPMLPIAEDLGLVPDSIRAVLTDLGICGTKVMRWEKRGDQFIDPLHYNPISMTTVSTHDSSTLAEWWDGDGSEAKPYARYKGWDYTPNITKTERREILWDSHHSTSLFHINLLGEYLAFFPELVWENMADERINVPGTVNPHNWTYRIRPSVEEILAHTQLKEEIKKLL